MKNKLLLMLALVLPLAVIAAAPEAKTAAEAAKERHPLKGVVMGILADRQALLVKHDEIPGVMRAMTMMFKVDADTLKAAKEGAVLNGKMVRRDGAFWLEDVTWEK